MMKFDKYGIFDLLRFTLSMTTDEKVMLATWRAFRAESRGPLFAVKLPDPAKRRAQFEFNRIAIEALRDLHTSVADIIRLTHLNRSTVERHCRRWSDMTEPQRQARRESWQRLLDHADQERIAFLVEGQREKARRQRGDDDA